MCGQAEGVLGLAARGLRLLLRDFLGQAAEEEFVGLAEGELEEHVGPAQEGAAQGLLPPPALDAAVVAGEQDVGHGPVAELGRAGVVRILQQAGGVRVVLRAGGVAQHAGPQPGHGVHNRQRGQLAAGEHKVAERDFVGGQVLADALVKAFVAPADEGQARLLGQGLGDGLGEGPALRGHQDDGRTVGGAGRAEDGLDGGEDRLGLHNHAAAAAVGQVVGDVVFAAGVVADVVHLHVEQAGGLGALEDGLLHVGLADGGEEGEQVEAEHGGIVMRKSEVRGRRSEGGSGD